MIQQAARELHISLVEVVVQGRDELALDTLVASSPGAPPHK
jgi:hypothetical protein